MSMRDYAVDDYGMLLNTDTLRILASKLCDNFTEDDWNEDKYDCIEYVADKLNIECISEFTGEAMAIGDDGYHSWRYTSIYSAEPIYYIGVALYPSLFLQAYKDIGELIEEFKSKVGAYLPEDFGYRQAVRHIVGTYFG